MNIYLKTGTYTFYNSLVSGNGNLVKAMVAESLTADVFDFGIMLGDSEIQPLMDVNGVYLYDANGVQLFAMGSGVTIDETDFVYGQPVELYDEDGNLVLRMYLNYLERTGINAYTLHCQSAVGFLASITHNGGMYNGAAFEAVLADIMDATLSGTTTDYKTYTSSYGWTYTVETEVCALPVSNWLPIDSCRNNIMQLLIPYGVSMLKNNDGSLIFEFSEAAVSRDLAENDIYIGSKVPASENVTDVTITEHAFIADPNVADDVLYDNTSTPVTDLFVSFDGPYHDIVASAGLTINSANCNYAIVSGMGTLTGKAYAHVTIDRHATTGRGGTKKEASVKNMTLINELNSDMTLKRFVNYYQNAELIKGSFVLNWYEQSAGQTPDKCGDFLNFVHPYTKQTMLACLKEMAVVLSAIPKGQDAQFITNWVPKFLGTNYSNYQAFTADGTFTVPPGVEKIRLVLSGGGQGGTGGDAGAGGYNNSNTLNYRTVNDGGEGGVGGQGGKLLTLDLNVTEGDVITFVIGVGGAGGAGGAPNGAYGGSPGKGSVGSDGTPTTATLNGTTYSSDDGGIPSSGWTNVLTGDVYGVSGDDGVAGAPGGNAGNGEYGGSVTYDGVTYTGGEGIDAKSNVFTGEQTANGGGGGAAVGANGAKAVSNVNEYTVPQGFPLAGTCHAGVGATPIVGENAVVLSAGGNGGHGGGGSGMIMPIYEFSGTVYPDGHWEGSYSWTMGYSGNPPNAGGAGSAGGKGGNGIAVVYY